MQLEGTLSGPNIELERESVRDCQPVRPRFRRLRWLFSFPALLSTLLTGFTFASVRGQLNDPDLWWHMKLGQVIWRTHSIPRTDFFSFTTHGHAWIAHEWLAELTIYGAWRFGGYTGLMLWLWLLPSLLCVLLYVLCSLYSGNAKVALLGGLTGWFFATIGLAVRPLVIGHLCLVLELLFIFLARTRSRRWLFALPPLFAIWVNCHGSYMLGLVVLGVVWCCSFLSLSAGSLVSERWPADLRRWLSVAMVLSVGALFVNPIGIRLVTYPFDLFLHQSHNTGSVAEWQPLNPHDVRAWGLFAIAAILFLTALIRRSEFRLDELILLAMGFGLAIWHQRMLFVFGILAAPVLSRLFANDWESYDTRRDHRIMNAILMCGMIAAMAAAFPGRADLDAQVKKSNPVGAVEFIRRTGLPGPMLNDYGFGGYLIWALPEQKVFIDGRADVFDWTGVFSEVGRWALLQENPTLLLNRYGINYCLLTKNAPMAYVLPFLPGWKRVYADDLAVIFARAEQPSRPAISAKAPVL